MSAVIEIHDRLKKRFSFEYQSIQDWFNKQMGVDSIVSFYKQPIFKHELLMLYLFDRYNIKIDTDCRYLDQFKDFKFIYQAVSINDEETIIPNMFFSSRVAAELHAFEQCLLKLDASRVSNT